MAKKDMDKKYRILKQKCEEQEVELKNLKNSRIYRFVNKLPSKLSRWLLDVNIQNNSHIIEKKNEEDINNLKNDKKLYLTIKNIFFKLKEIICSFIVNIPKIIKKFGKYIFRKSNEIYFSKKSEVRLIKTNNNEYLDNEPNNEIYKEEVSIIIVIKDAQKSNFKAIYNILHQPYINFKILLMNIGEKDIDVDNYLTIDSRIIYRKIGENKSFFSSIEDINSEYIIITNNINEFRYSIKIIIKILKKNYIMVLKNEKQNFMLSFKNIYLNNIPKYLEENEIHLNL